MVKILLGLSMALALAAGTLSFMTQSKVATLKSTLQTSESNLKSTTATLGKTKEELKTSETSLATANSTIGDREKDIAKQKDEIKSINEAVAAAKADVEAKVAVITDLQDKLEKATVVATPGGPTVSAEELQAKVNKAQADLAEAVQAKNTLEAQKRTADEKLAVASRQVKEYKDGFVRTGLSGKVLAFNPGWNFVVLSIGDNQGLKANAQMVVLRGGQAVGKVKVTTVEPSSSIADILPGSVKKGDSVQPGDTVVFEGRR